MRSLNYLSVVALAASCALPAALASPMAKGQPTSSETCGGCHRDIYRMWRSSAHANSMEDTVFLDGLHDTEARGGAGASRLCLKCHAPLIDVNGDTALEEKVTWEGVSCDVCHSLVSVDLSGKTPSLKLDVGPVKRGPIKEAVSTGHEVAYSELHTGPLVCAGCHEYANPEGTPIITTYSEWKASSAAKEGKTCQACHMGRTHADVVDPRVKRVAKAEVNLHEMPGGHSLDQLHKALGIAMEPRRQGEVLLLDVVLTNKGAGHAVPTGMPGRRVVMNVEVATSAGTSFAAERVFGKLFKDAAGDAVTRDGDNFWSGVRLASDTRIGADERRTESFRFDVPAAATAFVKVALHYEHAPAGGSEGRTWITFLTESRTLPPQAGGIQ